MALGKKTGGGSRKGKPNKVSRDLRAAIIEAFYAGGGVTYLLEQSKDNPVAFMSLLGKVVPKEIEATVTGTITMVDEFSGQ